MELNNAIILELSSIRTATDAISHTLPRADRTVLDKARLLIRLNEISADLDAVADQVTAATDVDPETAA